MALLYLVTHAHTHQVPHVAAHRWSLSHAGRLQAEGLAALPMWETIGLIVMSSEMKCRLTVEPVLIRCSIPILFDSRFDELRRSGWVGERYSDLVDQAFALPEVPVCGWESAARALGRFERGVADLSERLKGRSGVLIGHGLTFSLYRARLLGLERVQLDDWARLPFAAMATVDLENQRLITDFSLPKTLPRVERGG